MKEKPKVTFLTEKNRTKTWKTSAIFALLIFYQNYLNSKAFEHASRMNANEIEKKLKNVMLKMF